MLLKHSLEPPLPRQGCEQPGWEAQPSFPAQHLSLGAEAMRLLSRPSSPGSPAAMGLAMVMAMAMATATAMAVALAMVMALTRIVLGSPTAAPRSRGSPASPSPMSFPFSSQQLMGQDLSGQSGGGSGQVLGKAEGFPSASPVPVASSELHKVHLSQN